MEEERRVNRLLRDDPENEKLNERLQQVRNKQFSINLYCF